MFIYSACYYVYLQCLLLCLFTVQSAKFSSSGGLFSGNPDTFLELTVDQTPPRRTEVYKKSTNPKWDEHFTV